MSRLEAVKALVQQSPDDSRIRFMLCMEFMSASRFAEALDEFDALLARDSNYVTAYYQAGRAAEELGRPEHARSYYGRGIETARRIGDAHALSELQVALDLLG